MRLAAHSSYIEVFYVFLSSLVYSHISLERLIVNSYVYRIASHEMYGCLKASFEEIKIELYTYAGDRDWNGKWKRSKNEKRDSVREQHESVQQFSRLLDILRE